MTFAFIAILAYMLAVTPYGFLRDGSTARHIVCGDYMLEHGKICTTNFLWYVDPLAPWLSTELLSDLLFAWLYNAADHNYQPLVALAALACAAALALAGRVATLRGVPSKLAYAGLFLAFLATSLHWSARPHVFSYLAMAAVLLQARYTIALKWLCAALFLLFALWINLHASAILGLIALAFLAFERYSAQKAKAFVPLCAALAGTLCNVRGPGYFSYLWEYSTNPHTVGSGSEWSTFDTAYGIGSWAFLLLIALWALSRLMLKTTRENIPQLLLTAGFIAAGFFSMRFIPYASLLMLATLPVTASLPLAAIKRSRALHAALIAVSLVAVCIWSATYKMADMNKLQMPVVTSNYLKNFPPDLSQKVKYKGLCYDNWSNYLALKCKRPFFIDDKTDFYPSDFNVVYRACLAAEPGYEQFFKSADFGYVLVPQGSPLRETLRGKMEYRVVAQDKASVLFYRNNF